MQTYIPTPIKAISAMVLLRSFSMSGGMFASSNDHHQAPVTSCTHNPSGGWANAGEVFLVAGNRLPKCSVFSDAALFQQLAQQWHNERGATSSITQMAMCRSYQRIIGMGASRAIPLILNDIVKNKDEPDHWFWALQMLSGEDPVPPDHRGDMRLMAKAWLQWGYLNGYAS